MQFYRCFVYKKFYSNYLSFSLTLNTAAQRKIKRQNTFRLLQRGTPLLRVCQLVRRIGYPYTRESMSMSSNIHAPCMYMYTNYTPYYTYFARLVQTAELRLKAKSCRILVSTRDILQRPLPLNIFLLCLFVASLSTVWSIP